jgi:hypothetical protein
LIQESNCAGIFECKAEESVVRDRLMSSDEDERIDQSYKTLDKYGETCKEGKPEK